MASEIRVDKINSLSGVGTVTLSPTGVDIAGITTAATLRATTGIVTSLTAGSLTSLGAVSGTTGTFSGAVSGTTGTFTGDVDIADKIVHTGDTNTTIRFPAADTFTVETGGTERLRITSDGKVSVNHSATSGMAPLSVKNTDDDNINVFEVYNDNGNNSGGFSQASDGDGTIFAKKNDGTLSIMFRSDGDSYVLGDFGVGTSSPQSSGLTVENSSEARLRVRAGSNASNGEVALRADGGNTQLGTWSDHDLKLVRNTTEVASLNANGIAFPSGYGIDFSATGNSSGTMSSELFDDYEEGSWTPALEGTTTTGTVTYAANIGKYVKIGKVVTWEFYMNFNSGNGAGFVHISGLPFTTANNSTYPSVNIGYVHNFTVRSDHILTGLHANNDNYLYFYERPNGGGTNVQLNYDGSGSLIMSGHYQAT